MNRKMPSLITKFNHLIPRSTKTLDRDFKRRGSAIGNERVQIDHLHFIEDYRKECFLKQMNLEKNRMQTHLKMDEIRRELSQMHCQSQEFLLDVKKLDRDIENERVRRLNQEIYASTDHLYYNDSICNSNPEFSKPPSPIYHGLEESISDLSLSRPGSTALSEGIKRISIESDFESPDDDEFTEEYTFQRKIKYRSERPVRHLACNLMAVKSAQLDSFSEQVFAVVRDTITAI